MLYPPLHFRLVFLLSTVKTSSRFQGSLTSTEETGPWCVVVNSFSSLSCEDNKCVLSFIRDPFLCFDCLTRRSRNSEIIVVEPKIPIINNRLQRNEGDLNTFNILITWQMSSKGQSSSYFLTSWSFIRQIRHTAHRY